jgi:hypothetical protein
MDLHAWLDLPGNDGKAAWLAGEIGRSKAAVSLWRESGVPMHLMPQIEKLSGGIVTVDAMLRHALAKKMVLRREHPAPAEKDAAAA